MSSGERERSSGERSGSEWSSGVQSGGERSGGERSSGERSSGDREALAQRLIAIRRQLHQQPELSGEEVETTAAIKRWLSEAGIRIVDSGLATGVIAEIGGGGNDAAEAEARMRGGAEADGEAARTLATSLPAPDAARSLAADDAALGRFPVVALRADIDALPIREETELSFASSVEGRMHACGHDYHTAALLGAALLLQERAAELPGTVRLLFQPAEEKAKGAQYVIAHGALEGVDAIFGLHNKPELPVGTIGVRPGAMMAAADGFVVEVDGIGTHAASPEQGLDPIVVAAHMITALQTIVSRNVGALESAVVSVTRLHAGSAWNVISEQAVFDGTIRTFAPEVRERTRARLEQIVSGIASAFGTSARVRWIQGPPAVVNDAHWADFAARTAAALELTVAETPPSPAGEDFAFYLERTPGAFLFVGTNGPHPWHHPAFDIDEGALIGTAELLAVLAADALTELAEATQANEVLPL